MRRAVVAIACVLAVLGCARAVPLVKGEMPVVTGTLAGGIWVVEDINGGGVIDNARAEMRFDDGRVSGMAGCNRFNGAAQQDGTAVRFGPLATTRKACAPALMAMEAKLLGTLAAATEVRFEAAGAAVLVTGDGRRVKMRRE